MKVKGFTLPETGNQRYYYIDKHGKDPRNDIIRWRVDLYYKSHYAHTHFMYSKKEYNEFLEAHKNDCFKSFDEYEKVANWWQNGHKEF